MSKFAWVTLATNDAYSLGALVLANSLKRVGTAHQLVVMVTPGVTDAMKSRLQSTFNLVQEVNIMDSKDSANLALLARPDLGITFTKLNCWRLTQFDKCVFLDADTLVIQKCDELFEREELSAAPDVGWPDCFNSGVFVYKPSDDTFQKLTQFALEKGSFDGGDQGLLNSYFSDWATKDINKHLPFTYNTCTTAMYSYLPAFKQHGKDIKILHFIGQLKPWLVNFDSASRRVFTPPEYGHLADFLQLWWNIFCDQVHSQLSTDMLNTKRCDLDAYWFDNPTDPFISTIICSYNNQWSYNINERIEFIDPWDEYYEKQIDTGPSISDYSEFIIDTTPGVDHYEEQFEPIVTNQMYHNIQSAESTVQTINSNPELIISQSELIHNDDCLDINHAPCDPNNYYQTETCNEKEQTIEILNWSNINKINNDEVSNSDPSYASNYPCNQIPLTEIIDGKQKESQTVETDTKIEQEAGLAGALAKLTLGSPRSAEQEAYENQMRKQCWESGNIDYLGRDSFDNIWRRITQTLESGSGQDEPKPSGNESVNTGGKPVGESQTHFPLGKPNYWEPEPVVEYIVEKNEAGNVVERKVIVFPEHELEVKREEDRKKMVEKCVAEGRFPPGNPDFWNKPENADVEFVKEKLPDGRTVQRKIITYHGVETEETEETEEIEIDGKIVSRKVNTADPKKQIIVKKDEKKVKEMPAEAKSFLESEILETDKVERDEKTNTTTITRKTATGYQQKIITVDERGLTKTQIKTFYDPVEVAGEEEEEEEEIEETETIIPAAKRTTTITTKKKTLPSSTTTITDETKLGSETHVTTDTKSSTVVIPNEKSEKDNVSEKIVSDNHPKGEPVEKIIYEIDAEGRQIQKKITVYPGKESEEQETSKEVQKADVSKKITTQITTTTTKTATATKSGEAKTDTTDSTDTQTTEGDKNIKTIVSADGKTTTTTTTITKPVEVEEFEEVIPAKVTVTKTVDSTKTNTGGDITKSNVVQATSENTKVSQESSKTSTESSLTSTTTKTTTKTTKQTTSSTQQLSQTTESKETSSTQQQQQQQQLQQQQQKRITSTGEETEEVDDESDENESSTTKGGTVRTTTKKKTTVTKQGVKKVKPAEGDGEDVTTVEEVKIEGGVKKIYTTKRADGSMRVQTKTFYDAVEVAPNDPRAQPQADKPTGTTNADGETTTVEEKKIEGGTTFIYTTTRADGTKKVETKTFYDAVEVPCSDNEGDDDDDDATKAKLVEIPKKEVTPPPPPPPKKKLPTPEPEPKPKTKEEEEAEISRIKVMQLKKKLGLVDDPASSSRPAPPPPKKDFTKGNKKTK